MTDKQMHSKNLSVELDKSRSTATSLIIDGVDVSGCEYWKGYCRIASLCDYPGHLCEVTPNCHYKQLKRKEQEIEELKEINSTLLEYRRHAVTCQDCYEDGLEDGKTSNKELRKLRKTLAEIKEIVEKLKNFYEELGKCEDLTVVRLKQILQKINEVENG